MEDFNILCLIYDAAHNFIATNRPNEIKLFETFYPTKLPHDSFVSVYESGRERDSRVKSSTRYRDTAPLTAIP